MNLKFFIPKLSKILKVFLSITYTSQKGSAKKSLDWSLATLINTIFNMAEHNSGQYDDIHESLNLQLSEIEILQSMFTEGKELNVDLASLTEIQDFLSGSTNVTPKRIAFTLKLYSEHCNSEDYLELSCCLPQRYPNEMPEIYVKSSSLTREMQKELNESTDKFLTTLERGDLCIVTIVQWLQDTWPDFHKRSVQFTNCKDAEVSKTENKETKCEQNLTRIWLYMHHIYSKTKRKHIIDWANESKLTGFSLPGKPGVVCIEGDSIDTEEYFSRLRRLNWKKITCRHKELAIGQRTFVDFKELVFRVHGSGDDRMDFGEFFQFLVKHDLGDMFKTLFGIEGKLNSDN